MAEKVRNFRDLLVWQKSMDLTAVIYDTTRRFPQEELFVLSSQLRKAAVSVPCNIAEGHSRQYDKEFKQFLHVSLGSLAEIETQLYLAQRLLNVDAYQVQSIIEQINEIRKMCWGLIRTLEPN